ncbi:hypothetical protein, partial [Klebsiella pneumoniae]|uniref:hypothetical protein n=1 Tax=Klebsiella pneumoniae TaxID=573 RepID=UPI001968DAE1
TSDRRWAILAVCVVEWEAAIADAIVETHDRIVGKTWREAKRQHGVLGIFRPKTTKCSGGPAVCGLQRGITFFEIPIWALFE